MSRAPRAGRWRSSSAQSRPAHPAEALTMPEIFSVTIADVWTILDSTPPSSASDPTPRRRWVLGSRRKGYFPRSELSDACCINKSMVSEFRV
jgi:hypothetical protein